MKISNDKRTVLIDIAGYYTAEHLDKLIRQLALARAELLPPVAKTPEALSPSTDLLVESEQGATIRLRKDGGFRLWLRHRGLGWLAWEFDARFARGMADFIARRTAPVPGVDLVDEKAAKRH